MKYMWIHASRVFRAWDAIAAAERNTQPCVIYGKTFIYVIYKVFTDIRRNGSNKDNPANLVRCACLQALDLAECRNLSDDGLASLSSLTELTSLDLSDWRCVWHKIWPAAAFQRSSLARLLP